MSFDLFLWKIPARNVASLTSTQLTHLLRGWGRKKCRQKSRAVAEAPSFCGPSV